MGQQAPAPNEYEMKMNMERENFDNKIGMIDNYIMTSSQSTMHPSAQESIIKS